MFILKLLIALVQAPLRRVAELLGLEEQESEPHRPEPRQPEPPRREAVPTPLRARPQRRRPTSRGPAPAPPPSPKAKVVDEEPVLAAEFAEEGAEDGAGAEVHVDEPWDGYSQMRVDEIKQRLEGASLAEAAAVELYEAGHRGRKSVLAAVAARARH